MRKFRFPRAFVQIVISLTAFIMPALGPVSTVEAKPAAAVDKTGLDILCNAEGGLYVPPDKGGLSACAFNDGQLLVCDSKKDKCTASPTKADVKTLPKVTINEEAINLRMLKQLTDKVETLTSQIQSLRSTLNNGRAEGQNDPPAAP